MWIIINVNGTLAINTYKVTHNPASGVGQPVVIEKTGGTAADDDEIDTEITGLAANTNYTITCVNVNSASKERVRHLVLQRGQHYQLPQQ